MTMTTEAPTTEATATEANTTVTVRAKDLHNAIKNVVLFTSKDDTLPILTAGHMLIRGGNFIIEGTDRYRLVQINITDDYRSEALLDGEPIAAADDQELGMLSTADMKKLEQLLREPAKDKNVERIVHLRFIEDYRLEVELEAVGTAPGLSTEFWQIVGDYPNLNSLFNDTVPETDDGVMTTAFNPKYLQDVARLRDWREGPNDGTIRMGLYKGNKPATFHAVNGDGRIWAQALLMPIRLPISNNDGDTAQAFMSRPF